MSALGIYLSVVLDLPTGATIVCTFGGVLILMFIVHLIFYHRKKYDDIPDTAPAAVAAAGPAEEEHRLPRDDAKRST